jgi:hypothetical protein
MQRMGGGMRNATRKRKQRAGGNDPSCGCDMQAGWPKFLTDNIPLPSVGPSQPTAQRGGGSCGIPPIPNYYQGGGGCAACSGLPLPTPLQQQGGSMLTTGQRGGGQPTYYNSNPVPDACPFPGTGYCNFYARGGNYKGGANYGEPMYLQARLRGGGCGCGLRRGGYRPTKKNLNALKKWRKGQSIGFTMTSSLKAKGLIPRTSRKNKGKKVVSAKYK